MHDNALLGFLDVLLATCDFDLGLLMRDLFLLASDFLVPVVMLIEEVDLDPERITKLVDT